MKFLSFRVTSSRQELQMELTAPKEAEQLSGNKIKILINILQTLMKAEIRIKKVQLQMIFHLTYKRKIIKQV